MKTVSINNTRFILIPFLEKAGIVHAFSTKDIARNSSQAHALIKKAFPSVKEIATAKQVHGKNVLFIKQKNRASHVRHVHADIVISAAPGVAAAVRTADCVPILLCDPEKGVAAAVHSGWKGTAAGVAQAAVSAMQELGCVPSNMLAGIGPAIRPCHYQVDEPVINKIRSALPSRSNAVLLPDKNNKAKLDLSLANRIMLEQSGIPGRNIHVIRICTYCHQELFFSYRRQGPEVPSLYNFILPRAF